MNLHRESIYSHKMNALRQVANDPDMMMYTSDGEYTCFEDHDTKIVHCTAARFDDCWSSSALLQVAKIRKVSPYIPLSFQDSALKWKYPNTIVHTLRDLTKVQDASKS